MTISSESSFTTVPRRKLSRIVVIAVVGVVIAAIVIAVVMVTRPPTREDFSRGSDLVTDLEKKTSSLSTSKDAYFLSVAEAFAVAQSVPEVEDKSREALEAFLSKEAAVTTAIATLRDAPAARDAEVGPAIDQLTDIASDRTRYLGSLVRQRVEFRSLFGENNTLCSDIFIVDTETLAERSEKMRAATPDCRSALAELRDGGNSTYVEFAVQVERRITWLEEDSATAAETEATTQSLESQLEPLLRAEAELTARGAPDEEFETLFTQVEALNDKITENQAVFDYAGDRYIETIKSFPDILGAALATGVEERMTYFDAVSGVRTSAARIILDEKASPTP